MTVLPLLMFLMSAWLAAAVFYPDLPNQMPTHWSALGRADGFAAKPWGPFVLPLTMTALWLARPVIYRLSSARQRFERFPGAFDFRLMLTIGLFFVIWNLVLMQSVSWLRVAAVPLSVALILAGRVVGMLPFSVVDGLGTARFLTREADWLRARRLGMALCVATGVTILSTIAFGN